MSLPLATEIIPKNYMGINLSGNYSTPDLFSNSKLEIQVNVSPFYACRINNFVLWIVIQYDFQYVTEDDLGYLNLASVKSNFQQLSLPSVIRYYTKKDSFLRVLFYWEKVKNQK